MPTSKDQWLVCRSIATCHKLLIAIGLTQNIYEEQCWQVINNSWYNSYKKWAWGQHTNSANVFPVNPMILSLLSTYISWTLYLALDLQTMEYYRVEWFTKALLIWNTSRHFLSEGHLKRYFLIFTIKP